MYIRDMNLGTDTLFRLQGIAREAFHTLDIIPTVNEQDAVAAPASGCCVPAIPGSSCC